MAKRNDLGAYIPFLDRPENQDPNMLRLPYMGPGHQPFPPSIRPLPRPGAPNPVMMVETDMDELGLDDELSKEALRRLLQEAL